MDTTSPDPSLLQILAGSPPASIEEVIERLKELDAAIGTIDGLKWFNLLYLMVTEQILNQPPAGGWSDAAWIDRLDVVFANLYFTTVSGALKGNPIPSSWQALFEARQQQDVDRIQFALAGMNAHINHDLPLALLQLSSETHIGFDLTTPEHSDYEHVNDLLEATLPQALEFLATGVLGELAQDTGRIGRLLAIVNVRVSRDLAWDFAGHLENLSGLAFDVAVRSQDMLTGTIGRALLMPIPQSKTGLSVPI